MIAENNMYAITLEPSQQVISNPGNVHELYPLFNLINIIFAQLKFIRSQSPNGSVLNEIIERTEVVAINIQHNEYSVLEDDYLKDYQKNLWQQLYEFNAAEINDGRPSNLVEHKAIFFDLFRYLEHLVQISKLKTAN